MTTSESSSKTAKTPSPRRAEAEAALAEGLITAAEFAEDFGDLPAALKIAA